MSTPTIIARIWIEMIVINLILLGGAGCRSFGPGTVPRDRFDYSAALATSWKDTMLLNIVKTRYLDLPIFLDVGQVVSAYTLEASGTVGGSLNGVGAPAAPGNSLALGAAARYSQQPTITYNPMTGDKFLEGFLSPVNPTRVFALVQSGYAADFILQLGLESLNGLRNEPVTLGSKYHADPEFFRVLKLLREIQDAHALGIRVTPATNGQPAAVFFFRSDRTDPDVQAKIDEVRNLLSVAPGQNSFRLIASPLRGDTGELGVETRSLSQILASLSLGVELPARHVERKLAPAMLQGPSADSLLRIHSGSSKPEGAYAAVPYEGEWFWIANDDWISKRSFTSLLFLFTLAETSGSQNAPTLTIPAR